jgi:hypothetical protein
MLQAFFKRLKHPDPDVRLKTVEELGRIEDERALDPLREAYKTETDPRVKAAIKAAGKRIHEAAQARTQPRSRSDQLSEEARAARIVSNATAASPDKPSVGDTLKNMAVDSLVLGGGLGMMRSLSRQSQRITQETATQEQFQLEQEMHALMDEARRQQSGESTEPEGQPSGEVDEDAYMRELGFVDDEAEDNEPPKKKSIIRRLKPRDSD